MGDEEMDRELTVYIVEDEPGIREIEQRALERNGFSTETFHDGEEMLERLKEKTPDLILLDIMLPGMDGITILKTLREEKNQVPVLLLTAKDDISDKVKGLDCGADDYMTKPFSTDELLARVRALTRRKGDVKEETITLGDLTLNKNNCELQKVGGEAIKLSLKEFQIIDLLFENPHQIIKKERIIEKIWGGDSDAEYNNVEVYISFIRKKMEQLKVKAQIRTARGIGYSLEEGK